MVDYGQKFHWADYLLFSISFAVTIGVGVFFAVKDKWHKQSTETYLMADRNMNWFLVGMSFLATAMSALLFVGITAEFYYFGMTYIWIMPAVVFGGAFTAIFVIPKFYRIGFEVTSAYEYFQYRFNLPTRMVVGFSYTFIHALYMSVALYIPSLVLSKVSVINIYGSIGLGAGVCMIYTSFGGMKGVIWVDNIQVIIIAVGMCTLAVKGTIDVGGFDNVWQSFAKIGERDNWNDIQTFPWDRHNVWNMLFLMTFYEMAELGTPQSLLQRYMTVPSLRRAQASIMVGILLALVFQTLVIFIAMAAFAGLGGNEPLLNGHIDISDEILPYFLMVILGNLHGIPGLVVAALFAAALSTLSSGQNALAAVLLEDVIRPSHKLRTGQDLTEKKGSLLSRTLSIAIGIFVLCIAMAVPSFPNTLLSLAVSVQSFIIGPLLGLMLVAFFCFWVEGWGALVGFLCATAWTMMMFFGQLQYGQGVGYERRPLFNASFTQRIDQPDPTVEPIFWDVSYTWLPLMAVCVMFVVSTIVSLIVHCHNHGRIRSSDFMPDKKFLYTTDDFLVALGCRKNDIVMKKKRKNSEIIDTTENHTENGILAEKREFHVDTYNKSAPGYINPSFESTNL